MKSFGPDDLIQMRVPMGVDSGQGEKLVGCYLWAGNRGGSMGKVTVAYGAGSPRLRYVGPRRGLDAALRVSRPAASRHRLAGGQRRAG